ncbi:hypothetical protein GTF97_04300 [Roseobacter sp. HKCCD8767]|nr:MULTISPECIES: hypothetical protein [unclassified Roseobacter]NNV29119.1 hypothetical protein [Roseobacter sp. HKCCD9061]NNV67430.1 hypothetical protein [Roseobacter sp. HKCCD8474]NNV92985.1 hypothetical protein [Roseobacter sp. HKCCD8914]NNW10015.1 hypothetical protein [Roseobacter sp. HKCCD8484]NNW18534.1 hypothetical protein [Roseobacter sp. HKCCD7543]NNW39841.1 hypothetical protein [Roseobacter sp. HKCCD8654]NNW44107.1 hypothetical protein [Roseobacter sp. HKCCD8291]NNW78209.1 hypothe
MTKCAKIVILPEAACRASTFEQCFKRLSGDDEVVSGVDKPVGLRPYMKE